MAATRRNPPSAPALSRDPGFLLARAGGRAIRGFNRALDELGLRSRHYTVLVAVNERGGLAQRELSEILDVDPSAVVAIVDDLQGAGHVTRAAHPDDRRTKMVVLTDTGRLLLAELAPLSTAVDEQILAALDPDERDQFIDMLRRVAGLT
ncbi:MarR family transcriptional regulator [Mycobacterium sp. AT1]|nr:MarR family transcriptional regulator [Mycobacterium sp. AT1]